MEENMQKPQDKETRYFIDLDLKTMKIIGWNYDQREELVKQKQSPSKVRIYITKGQYNKLVKEG
jgi:hypothetical protein